jgi:hypothetical protein
MRPSHSGTSQLWVREIRNVYVTYAACRRQFKRNHYHDGGQISMSIQRARMSLRSRSQRSDVPPGLRGRREPRTKQMRILAHVTWLRRSCLQIWNPTRAVPTRQKFGLPPVSASNILRRQPASGPCEARGFISSLSGAGFTFLTHPADLILLLSKLMVLRPRTPTRDTRHECDSFSP